MMDLTKSLFGSVKLFISWVINKCSKNQNRPSASPCVPSPPRPLHPDARAPLPARPPRIGLRAMAVERPGLCAPSPPPPVAERPTPPLMYPVLAHFKSVPETGEEALPNRMHC